MRRELEAYLGCGDVTLGFGWLACLGCDHQRLLAFSCKKRSFCPTCMSRRMTERSAAWVDGLFPFRPVRQWVLTVPFRRRWQFARVHRLVKGVLRETIAALQADYARRAGGGTTGSVTIVQRAGSALNLNIHFHILMIDGTFSREDDGSVRWRGVPAPTTGEVEVLVDEIARRAEAWLTTQGHGADDEDADETDAVLHAAAVEGQSAFARRYTQRLGGREVPLPPLCAVRDGYNLHAGVSVLAHRREALERLCRYVLRPPVARARLSLLSDGRVALTLKRPWADGTTEKVFTPAELVERLAAIVAPPHANQIFYHGVLASQSLLRADILPKRPKRRRTRRVVSDADRSPAPRWLSWCELLRRVFDTDGFRCPHCGGRLKLRAVVLDGGVARKILRDLARGGPGPP